jgi:hypothetical protein
LPFDKNIRFFFAVDASGADGYDTLFFDVNHDLDLTNDPPLRASNKSWPKGLTPWLAANNRLMFEELAVPVDFGPGYGVRPAKYLPIYIKSARTVLFVPLSFRAGRIQIADHQFDAILGQEMVGDRGRLDGHCFPLYLIEPGNKRTDEKWWAGGDELNTFRFIDGKYYTFSATPIGDKLFVKPYRGELGTLKIGPGPRDIRDCSAEGSITSPMSAVRIGKTEVGKQEELQPVTEWPVPVGDYAPYFLSIHYDALTIDIRCNSHADGEFWNHRGRPQMLPIHIRKDKPFVLELAIKPTFCFPYVRNKLIRPEKAMVYKPGEEVNFRAVLIDPVLGILYRGVEDSRRKISRKVDLGDGKKEIREENKSLDPVVTITDSHGKVVSEGPMPFC